MSADVRTMADLTHPSERGYSRLDTVPDPLPDAAWVYELWSEQRIPRAIGSSHRLYVGQGGKQRIEHLRSGVHHALGRRNDHNTIRASHGLGPIVPEAWVKQVSDATEARLQECLQLNDDLRRHGELPLLNRQAEGWLAGRVMKALMKGLLKKEHPEVADWPTIHASHILSNAKPNGGTTNEQDWVALVWCWPTAWCPTDTVAHTDGWGGRLVLLEVKGKHGAEGVPEDGPKRLHLTDPAWWSNTVVTAWAPADCLAGASAADGADEKLRALWRALMGHGTLEKREQLREALNRAGRLGT